MDRSHASAFASAAPRGCTASCSTPPCTSRQDVLRLPELCDWTRDAILFALIDLGTDRLVDDFAGRFVVHAEAST